MPIATVSRWCNASFSEPTAIVATAKTIIPTPHEEHVARAGCLRRKLRGKRRSIHRFGLASLALALTVRAMSATVFQ